MVQVAEGAQAGSVRTLAGEGKKVGRRAVRREVVRAVQVGELVCFWGVSCGVWGDLVGGGRGLFFLRCWRGWSCCR